MRTVIVTDGKYRSSIAAVRMLGRAGYRVVVTQTEAEQKDAPPVFFSKYAAECRWISGSVSDREYTSRLLELICEYERPVLLCVGAVTLNAVAAERERFEPVCDFLIARPEVLDALNDKERVHSRCVELGIPVPRQFDAEPDSYPVVIKPHCGEKFGLKASARYTVAWDRAGYETGIRAMSAYDPSPIVQERISGDGRGASLLLDRDGRLIAAICHRRIREYPADGGPSTCCESFYDGKLIDRAYRLLRSFDFVGLAMVEFKGDRVLEVNPRIWGSFPMTEKTDSPFICNYASAAGGETVEYSACDYKTGMRMRFTLNDAAAALGYLRRGKAGKFFRAAADMFLAKEALAARDDPAPLRQYFKQTLFGRSK